MTAFGRLVFGFLIVAFLIAVWALVGSLGQWFGTAEWLVR